jgi:homoserine O-acetyltransferase
MQNTETCNNTHIFEDYEYEIDDFAIESGFQFPRLKIGYRLHGELGRPLVVALGGISAHRGLAQAADGRKPWWADFVGPGKALDTSRYCVVSFDYLGGTGRTTGPDDAIWERGLTISTRDQAQILDCIRQDLGYARIHWLVGASYGGMVGLAYAADFPDELDRLTMISAGHRSHPMAQAWRYIQRQIVTLTRDTGNAAEGLALARALAMTTYRSPEEFGKRFEAFNEVKSYLEACGQKFVQVASEESFMCLSRSIDDHEIPLDKIRTQLDVIGVWEDRLVPPEILQEFAKAGYGHLNMLHSHYGHDAFLKEVDTLTALLNQCQEVCE